MRTWEETIEYIRTKPEYEFLVEKAYFDANLSLNVERFRKSSEFEETVSLIEKYNISGNKRILDVGCGNGISCIAFALLGYDVVAVEPDPSSTIGAGAIRKLKEEYNLSNIEIYEAFAEDISFESNSFDIVYVRQAMHHANDLTKFVSELGRVLKKGGILVTIRDHVIFDQYDKENFLAVHPLQKFYGGENAFTPKEYREAMTHSGLEVLLELKYYDSEINYFPLTKDFVDNMIPNEIEKLRSRLRKKIGILSKIPMIFKWYSRRNGFDSENFKDERKIPGRMYSYVATKKRV